MATLKTCKRLKSCREEESNPLENVDTATVPLMQMQGTHNGVQFLQNEIPTSPPASFASAGMGSNWSDVIQDYSIAVESQELLTKIGDFGNEYEQLKLKGGERRTQYEQLEWIRRNPELQYYMPPVEQAISSLDNEIQIKVQELTGLEGQLSHALESWVRKMEILMNKVCTELLPPLKWSSWEMNDIIPSRDKIQDWYSNVINSIVGLSGGLKTCLQQGDIARISPSWITSAKKATSELDHMYAKLMSNAMVVEVQPKQNLKTKGGTFILSVRFLCGPKNFQGHNVPPVYLKLVNEQEMRKLYDRLDNKLKNDFMPNSVQKKIDEIVPAGRLEFSGAVDVNNGAVYCFQDVRVNDVTRKCKGNKSDVSEVMEEKYCFLFQSNFSIGPESFEIYCTSLPCVIYTHPNYMPDGWKTLFWENSFRQRNRLPFDVPDRVPWSRMAAALNKFIKDRTGTTRNLTPTNIAFLKEKFSFLFTNDQEYIIKADFEGKINPQGMTMWHYIYSIIELINKHLKAQWDKGYVVGFINREEAQNLLASQRDDGAFLVRFSDSKAGGVSIPFCWELPDGTFAADSVGPLMKDDDNLKNICQTIYEVAIDRYTRYVLLKSVYYKEITGEEEREELRTEHKMRAFPPNFSVGKVNTNPKPKWGYLKIVSVPVAVQDNQPIQNYSGPPPCQVNIPSQTKSSAFPQEQLLRTGMMCPGGGPAYETCVNNHADLLQLNAAADMELDMVD